MFYHLVRRLRLTAVTNTSTKAIPIILVADRKVTAMKQLFGDILLAAGNNELNVQMVPTPTPPDLYPAPPGWEWTRPIGEAEVRAAERRAASTGETLMEALLALYGQPIAPVGIAKILGVRQGPDVWLLEVWPIGGSRLTSVPTDAGPYQSIIVDWESYETYAGYWWFDFGGSGAESLWTVAQSPGRHETQTWIHSTWHTERLEPGIYPITISLSRAIGGITYPAVWDYNVANFSGTVEIK